MNFSDVFNVEQLIIFVVIFMVCTVGGVSKDVFDGFKGKVRINTKVILLSSLVVSILIWSMSDWILSKINIKIFFGVTIILGMLSYEITGKLTSINGVKSLFKDYMKFRDSKNTDDENKDE